MASFALLPSIFSIHKPSKFTSAISSVAVFIFGTTYLSVGFYGSATINYIALVLWIALLVQEIRAEKSEPQEL